MRGFIWVFSALLAAASSPLMAADARIDPVIGMWLNAEHTAKVETKACRSSPCAAVVWASSDALQKAKKAGTDPLLGLQLLSNYRQKARGTWEGQVFEPDLNVHLFSRIAPAGPNTMKLSGCVLKGLICKDTIWTRAEPPRPSMGS